MALQIKRVYDSFQESDGMRLLVDRLWPRGITKENAHLDGWVKELAPSHQLRIWFGHRAENFEKFAMLYQEELDATTEAQAAARQVILQSKENKVTLLYGAKDPQVNHAIILKEYLEAKVLSL
ncbi:hypothetical protein Desdi_1446 [Desulfitobacterium dichloroeliminans LMG P-21439]|uniref:DUF488 domain-containing protein n=1 Tax=Desulfitobacterium dichloroeliminans (strain LMG P-21439 / DCA1) TaxID=871963 RepID=L0F534_DESDL|nr:DUF488 family protein [Desulfitobacterium dichloroeliminans]AGA68944.1 hypothetical protein Desdi_1446 [Desulfitobacterium dichloroeliminans LMG P-21439]